MVGVARADPSRHAMGSAIIELMDRRRHGVWVGALAALWLGVLLSACSSVHPATSSTTTSQNETTANSTAAQRWNTLCLPEESERNNGWESTDSEGNNANVNVCGYTLTGEDSQGSSAPAGDLFLNLVLQATSAQTDRGAGVGDNVFVAPPGVTCPYYYTPNCTHLNTQFYDLTDTGGAAPDPSPSVQPNVEKLFMVSTVVPADVVQKGQFVLTFSSTNGKPATSTLGKGNQSTTAPIFQSP